MKNILYFEGAGMDFDASKGSDVQNYRIRTAFKNNDGIAYYIELGRTPTYDYSKKQPKLISEWGTRIDHLFKIEDRHKEEYSTGGYEIKTDFKALRSMQYTKKNIANWINENLNCSFNDIEVIDSYYDYRVHGSNESYNLMENVEINHERAAKRKAAFEKLDQEYRKHTGSKYRVISLLNMDDDNLSIRCHAAKELMGDKPREVTVTI